jgi:hypothetical protein
MIISSVGLGITSSQIDLELCFLKVHKEAKHTDTIFNVVRQTAYIHERGPYY